MALSQKAAEMNLQLYKKKLKKTDYVKRYILYNWRFISAAF
jgi:hypothetical protein